MKKGIPDLKESRNWIEIKKIGKEEIITRTINVTTGGFAGGGTTKLAHRKHLQEVLSLSITKMKKIHKPLSTLEVCFRVTI